jgi:voltage-gated potassium channel
MALGDALFSATQHLPFWTAAYWTIETATTVGYGDVTPGDAAGRWIAAGLMLTAIPLTGAAFGLLTSSHLLARVHTALDAHHKAIHDRLDRLDPEGRKDRLRHG